jgi:hypothetical protein
MRRLVVRVVVAALAAGGVGLAGATTAHAAGGDGTFFVLQGPYQKFYGTVPAGSQQPIPISGDVSEFVRVQTASAGADGTVSLGPCGSTPDIVVGVFARGGGSVNKVRATANMCLTPSATVQLWLFYGPYETTTPSPIGANRYVPLGQPETIFDSIVRSKPSGSAQYTLPAAASVPPDATGIAVDISGVGPSGSVQVSSCASDPFFPDLVLGAPTTETTNYFPTDVSDPACAWIFTAGEEASIHIDVLGYFTDSLASGGGRPPTVIFTGEQPPGFSPATPTRVLDTRSGVGAPEGKLAAGQVIDLDLSAHVGADSMAAVMNLTATEGEGPGYLTAYPCDEDRPEASNVNFVAGQNVPNLTTVKLSGDGHVCIYTFATTHVIADLAGTFELGGGDLFGAQTPARILDTRDGVNAPVGKLAAGQTLHLQVTGDLGVPAGATAVTLNLTATDADGPGFLTAYPCDTDRPEASNVNYVAGQTVPNLTTVKLAADGSVCIYAFATTHVVADLAGFFGGHGNAGFFSLSPQRVLDTRTDPGQPIRGGDTYVLDVTGSDPGTLQAVTLNLTATQPGGAGFLTAYPCDEPRPTTSNLNFVTAHDVANLATVKVGRDGTVCLYTFATTHVVADIAGFMDTSPLWSAELRVD